MTFASIIKNIVRSIFILAMLIPIYAAAGLKEGEEAYRNNNFTEAFKEFTKLAEEGDSNAQFNLGFMYGNGQGVTRDYAQALKWVTKAAELGNGITLICGPAIPLGR